ncbi:unnamed protein product [Effrenium voratum]|nr:unnamed protein product [Effrenium voratum]
MACGGNWRAGTMYKEIKNIHSNSKRGVRKWLTKVKLLDYFEKDSVDKIIERKELDKTLSKAEIRDHPECPGLKQYLTLVEDEETASEENRISDMFKMRDGETSSEAGDNNDDEVLNDMNRKIQQANLQRANAAKWSPNLRSALEKDIDNSVARLGKCRGLIQDALDRGGA